MTQSSSRRARGRVRPPAIAGDFEQGVLTARPVDFERRRAAPTTTSSSDSGISDLRRRDRTMRPAMISANPAGYAALARARRNRWGTAGASVAGSYLSRGAQRVQDLVRDHDVVRAAHVRGSAKACTTPTRPFCMPTECGTSREFRIVVPHENADLRLPPARSDGRPGARRQRIFRLHHMLPSTPLPGLRSGGVPLRGGNS